VRRFAVLRLNVVQFAVLRFAFVEYGTMNRQPRTVDG
jgi:hypothetical protein